MRASSAIQITEAMAARVAAMKAMARERAMRCANRCNGARGHSL